MLNEQRFFFLAFKAIVFTLSCVYGRSLFTGFFSIIVNPTVSNGKCPSFSAFVSKAACFSTLLYLRN